MRFKVLFAAITLSLAIYLVADPSVGQSQQRGPFQAQPPGGADPAQGQGKGKGKNKGMFGMDAEGSFKRMANGAEVITIDPNSMWTKGLAVWAEKNGVKDGKITKDQY